jgi:histidinol-phosphate aminotransferase
MPVPLPSGSSRTGIDEYGENSRAGPEGRSDTQKENMNHLIRKSVQAMQGYVPGEQPQDPEVIKLNTNENPYLPSAEVQDVLSMVDVSVLSRYPDPLCIELRKVIAELHGCGTDNVFVGNGSDEVLALSLRAFVERDGAVGYFDTSYSLYPVLADIEESAKKPVELKPGFRWNMPSDYAASLSDVQAFAGRFAGVVLIDEAYADFADDNCMELALQHENVLVSRTLSKAYSLAGIRLGYCVGHEVLIGALYKIKDSYNVNYLTQEIARAAILDQDTMHANVQAIVETRRLAAEKLEELGCDVSDSQTNFLWVKPLGIGAKTLFDALRKKDILVRYFGDDSRTRDYLRVTVGTAPEMFRFLDAVEAILQGGE